MDMELRHALLGLLSLGPRSGYDLGRAFAGSVAHFWHADQSQIYRTLDRLSDEGAITTETIAQRGRPDRHVHSLTPMGEDELEAWLRSPLEPRRAKDVLLARVFFAAPLGRAAVDELLAEAEHAARTDLEALRSIESPPGDLAATLRAATLRAGIIAAEAELAWLTETRLAVAAGATP